MFLISATCCLAFALIPVAILLYILFPDKFVIGFNYQLHAREDNSRGLTSEELAEMILKYGGMSYVNVVESEDEWGHSYEPDMNMVVLSKPFYGKKNMRAICAAIHECGHALQQNDNLPFARFFGGKGYMALSAAMFLVTLALCSMIQAATGLFMGAFVSFFIALVLSMVIPRLIKRPYEHDASRRAIEVLEEHSVFSSDEMTIIRKMLKKEYHDAPPNDETD